MEGGHERTTKSPSVVDMVERIQHKAKVERIYTEANYKGMGLEYKYKKIQAILESKEGQDALDEYCGPIAKEFRETFTKIGSHIIVAIPAAIIVGIPISILLELVWRGLK